MHSARRFKKTPREKKLRVDGKDVRLDCHNQLPLNEFPHNFSLSYIHHSSSNPNASPGSLLPPRRRIPRPTLPVIIIRRPIGIRVIVRAISVGVVEAIGV